jgi:ferredoxin
LTEYVWGHNLDGEPEVGDPQHTDTLTEDRGEDATMKVWIDQDLCTGDGLCEEIAPDVFTLLDDGLAYVKEGDKVYENPGGAEGLANVPGGMEEAVIESAEECPGECIFIEVD